MFMFVFNITIFKDTHYSHTTSNVIIALNLHADELVAMKRPRGV